MVTSIPSVKQLQRVFGSKAGEARQILEMNWDELMYYAEMAGMDPRRLARQTLKLHEVRMDLLDELSGKSNGVEVIRLGNGDLVHYLNMGDTYATTLMRVWDGLRVKYVVGNWGDLVERHGSRDNPAGHHRPGDFSDYTVRISTEPYFYGSDVTDKQGESIAWKLADMIEKEFPGIRTETALFHKRSSTVDGPDQDVVGTIEDFIEQNWIVAVRHGNRIRRVRRNPVTSIEAGED